MSSTKRIVVATHNDHKVAEIKAILDIPGWEFVSLGELGIAEEPVEDAESFLGNARIKARFAHEKTGLAALADDSGLVVDALDGAPGIYSSRYSGNDATASSNNAKLIRELEDIPSEARGAHFVCSLVFIDEDGSETLAEGTVEGRIGFAERGESGFGYDPLFEVAAYDYERTMAELDPEEKNALSHRYEALRVLKEKLASHSERSEESSAPAGTICTEIFDETRENVSEQPSCHSEQSSCHSERSEESSSPTGTICTEIFDETLEATHAQPKEIVVFDFDGTLIDASSPVRLIHRLNKDKIMPKRAVTKSILWGARYKLGRELDQAKPRRYIFSSFKDFSAEEANAIMHNLYYEVLRQHLRPQAVRALREHQEAGREVMIVSASFEPIIEACCKDLGIRDFICTQMEVKDGMYTGETIGEPPESEQKLIQFVQWANRTYGKEGWQLRYAYGDHYSDVPLMETAQHPIVVDPDRRLEGIAKKRGWTIHLWND